MSDRNPLDTTAMMHGYSIEPEVEEAAYMTGYVNRDDQVAKFRVGTDHTILEISLNLDELEELIESLEGNADELAGVIDLADSREDAADRLSVHMGESFASGDYPAMLLLWSWVDDNNLWGDFATWANGVVESGSLLSEGDVPIANSVEIDNG